MATPSFLSSGGVGLRFAPVVAKQAPPGLSNPPIKEGKPPSSLVSHVFILSSYCEAFNQVLTESSFLFWKNLDRGLNMISANNVTYRVGKKALFEDVNIKLTTTH